MQKEELEEVFYIKKEIQDLENRIYKKEKQSSEVSDVVQNGYKRHAVIYGIDVKRAYKIQYLRDKLNKYRIMLVEKQQEIENYIENIPFSEIRQICRYRYLDNYNWIQISHKMNELFNTEKYTEDSVRKKIERFFEKI